MKISVDMLFQKSFVISINESRYDVFCKRFNQYGLNTPLPKLFKGFTIPNGMHKECGFFKTSNSCNCLFSHIALVKLAQSLDLPFVCIFEDDAYPCINCRNKLQQMLDRLPDDIDLLKLGHLGSLKDKIVIDNTFEVVQTYGSHAYVVFKKYYDKYIELSNKDLHIDRSSMNKHDDNKVYATSKVLFIQNDKGFSDVLHDNQMYVKLLEQQNQLHDFVLN